jgi:hypothetical protein
VGLRIQEVVNLRQTTMGPVCLARILTTQWPSRTAVKAKLSRDVKRRQRVEKPVCVRRSLPLRKAA